APQRLLGRHRRLRGPRRTALLRPRRQRQRHLARRGPQPGRPARDRGARAAAAGPGRRQPLGLAGRLRRQGRARQLLGLLVRPLQGGAAAAPAHSRAHPGPGRPGPRCRFPRPDRQGARDGVALRPHLPEPARPRRGAGTQAGRRRLSRDRGPGPPGTCRRPGARARYPGMARPRPAAAAGGEGM
ncbi:MAG: hypothetical protein AVDCRST_MAG65-661, partial [uncultured Solirubrobacteraceae bacterium]